MPARKVKKVQRSAIIYIRLTENERKKLERIAATTLTDTGASMTLSSMARALIVAELE